MRQLLPNKIFVTGTGTDVGKTVLSAILMAGLKARYWKPVQSGLNAITDAQLIKNLTGLSSSHFFPETYRLNQPLSPHASAAMDGVTIKMDSFNLPEMEPDDTLIVEGAGGILVPLNEQSMMIDLMVKLDIPVLLVSANVLGTINHTLLSLELLKQRGLDVVGVILNGDSNAINKNAIKFYGKTSVLAEIPIMKTINPTTLNALFELNF